MGQKHSNNPWISHNYLEVYSHPAISTVYSSGYHPGTVVSPRFSTSYLGGPMFGTTTTAGGCGIDPWQRDKPPILVDGYCGHPNNIWLVVWNGLEMFGTWLLFFHILGIVIPTDFHVFQRGRSTTSYYTLLWLIWLWKVEIPMIHCDDLGIVY